MIYTRITQTSLVQNYAFLRGHRNAFYSSNVQQPIFHVLRVEWKRTLVARFLYGGGYSILLYSVALVRLEKFATILSRYVTRPLVLGYITHIYA